MTTVLEHLPWTKVVASTEYSKIDRVWLVRGQVSRQRLANGLFSENSNERH